MDQNRYAYVKSELQKAQRLHAIRECLCEVQAFADALMDIIHEAGLKEGLRFLNQMIADGHIGRDAGRELQKEARRVARRLAS